MNQASAFIHDDTLVYQEDGDTVQVMVGTPPWYRWLVTASTFAFSSEEGSFTAYREQAGSKRGGRYWKAYRKPTFVYLGKSDSLTLDRLKAAAVLLTNEGDATAPPDKIQDVSDYRATSPFHPQEEDSAMSGSMLVHNQLLAIKFFVPTCSHALIPRPRLTALLDAGLACRLTLVSASVGFGKTTLLSA